jgi:hypothetical protein
LFAVLVEVGGDGRAPRVRDAGERGHGGAVFAVDHADVADDLGFAVGVEVSDGGLGVSHHAEGRRLPLGDAGAVHRGDVVGRGEGDDLGLAVGVHVGDGDATLAVVARDLKDLRAIGAVERHEGVALPGGEHDVGDVGLVDAAVAVVVVEVAHGGHDDGAAARGGVRHLDGEVEGVGHRAGAAAAFTLFS